MKVLGISEEHYRSRKYIVEITASEINSVFNNSYSTKEYDKIEQLKVGDEINLALGRKFKEDIEKVCKDIITANMQFGKSQETLLEFAKMVIQNVPK